jgi:hypothetical protein
MTFLIVGLLTLLVIILLVMRLLKNDSLARRRVDDDLHDSHSPTLEYVVPTGEDPVVVLAALERAGYTAVVDSHGSQQVVLIKCPDGLDRSRSHVRLVIETAGVSTPKVEAPTHTDVHFRDEA